MTAPDGSAGDPPSRCVFVYGTLRGGGSNHHRMTGARFIASATVTGRLYRIDWYPGLVIDPSGGPVKGELYEVDAALFEALDAYEGSEYRKTAVDFEAAPAILWEWDGLVDEDRRISSGDWLEQARPEAGPR